MNNKKRSLPSRGSNTRRTDYKSDIQQSELCMRWVSKFINTIYFITLYVIHFSNVLFYNFMSIPTIPYFPGKHARTFGC